MDPVTAAVLGGFAVAAAATPVFIVLARRLGVVDEPGGRKRHRRATPLLGGAAVALGVLAGAWLSGVLDDYWPVFAAAGAVFAVGLLDDAWKAPAWLRLAVETAAAAAVVASGVRATFLVGHAWITAPVTVVWIVGITNAMNFLDNMDGLSAGVGAIAAALFTAVSFLTGQDEAAAALAGVAAASAGFLLYNFHPARIFLGDAGALTLGFLLGSMSVAMRFYEYEGTPLPLAAPVLVLAIPMFDTASVLWIRLRSAAPLSLGDRNHFSHRLVALGMSERAAVVTIWLVAGTVGLGAVLLRDLDWFGGAALIVQSVGVFAVLVLLELAGKRALDRARAFTTENTENTGGDEARTGRSP